MSTDGDDADDLPSSPPRGTADDPSQMTDGSRTLDSRRSTYSYEHLRHVMHQASEILTGRLPRQDEEDESPQRPSVIAFNHVDGRSTTTPDADGDADDENNTRGLEQQQQRQADFDHTEHAVAEGDDDDDEPVYDFLRDDPSEMTWARRIALALSDRQWYNPSLVRAREVEELERSEGFRAAREAYASPEGGRLMDAYPFTVSKREKPSLPKAWAYFEHVAMPRFIVHPKSDTRKKNIFVRAFRRLFCKGSKQLQRAEPGERNLPTELYRPIFTPHGQLGDWGLGIGLYFSTLRAVTVLTFFAGLLNIPNFMYFSGSDYSDGQPGVDARLTLGSAVCTETVWVPCADPCPTDDDNAFTSRRVRRMNHTETGEEVTFTLKNLCDGATLEQGFINYGTLVLVLVGIFLFSVYLKIMEVRYDEDEQTAQDYSIVVENPPADATDPEEWKKYFYDNFDGAHVTAITIAVDNDLLVRSLVRRREVLREIEMMVEPGTSMDTLTLAGIAAKEERARRFFGRLKAKVSPGVPELFAQLVVLTSKVQGLSQQNYPSSNIFVSFESEAGQRRVLEALSVGSLHVSRQKKAAVKNPSHLFRGEYVLSVTEPDEPSTIRWRDLNEKFKERLKQQLLTTFCTFASIVTIAFIVRVCNEASAAWSAVAISVFNSIFPMFAKFLCSFEAHSSEGGKQRSLYFKIALFRWVNTAIVITIITPFTATLSTGEDGLITKIYAIFFAELVTTNAIQLADPVGHLQRHFLAPRATSQDAMNLNMSGQEFELAERYTNMTKILFLAVWYCAIYPGTLFLCSFTLLVNYFTDRFSLMRTWKRPPLLGPKISQFSRTYFFTLAILAMAVMSSYYWAGFPFDNLCPSGTSVNQTWVGNWTDVGGGGSRADDIVVEAGDEVYKFCQQDFFRLTPDEDKSRFPFVSSNQPEGGEWMTDDQEILTDVYGWTVLGILCMIVLSFVRSWWQSLTLLFRGSYKARGDDQGIPFSSVDSISAYVPQVESPVYSYPLLACNIDGIDPELLDWTDPDRPYSFYDLTKDAEVLLKGMDVSSNVTFSRIVHYPPKDNKTAEKKSESES